ncbi:MAG: porin, partial [Sulfurifustis sp.]
MQKKVLAAVIGGLLAAPAFADVTISGRFADGIALYDRSGDGCATAGSCFKEQRLSDQSSRIIFSGSEDLGGGLKAWFQLDNRFSADQGTLVGAGGVVAANGTGFASGNTGVGLAGDWGKVTLGRWDLHYNELNVIEPYRAGALPNYNGMG